MRLGIVLCGAMLLMSGCGCPAPEARTVTDSAVLRAQIVQSADATAETLTLRFSGAIPAVDSLLRDVLRKDAQSRSMLRGVRWSFGSGGMLCFRFSYALPTETVRAYKACAGQQADEFAARVRGLPACVRFLLAYQRVLYAAAFSQDTADPAAHSAYGALCRGEAVCEGYAEALLLLCQAAEIPCLLVEGTAGTPQQPHAWNLVYLQGAWHHCDAAWDDCAADSRCVRFLMDDRAAAADHCWDAGEYPAAAGDPPTYGEAVAEMQRAFYAFSA